MRETYVASVPMQHPPVGRDFHATSAEVITEYGGLMGFEWVGFLATEAIGIPRVGIQRGVTIRSEYA